MLTQAAELQEYIDGKRKVLDSDILAPGYYQIRGNEEYRELHLRSLSKYGTWIVVNEIPLRLGQNSELANLCFKAVDKVPLFELDDSSRAHIHDNHLFAPRSWTPEDGKSEDFERRGYGIVTTQTSISEGNWKVRIKDNIFEWFKAGIECRIPSVSPIGNRLKGTARWECVGNDFDGCETALHLMRPTGFLIRWNHIQLHRRGIWIEHGRSCWVELNQFERRHGTFDIEYDAETCYVHGYGNTAPRGDDRWRMPASINEHVNARARGNEYRHPLRKKVLWKECGDLSESD